MPADSGSPERRFIRELLRRFTGWRVMTEKFDLIVIGTGTAARVAAMRSRAAGRSVAVIDSKPFGGTCALRGCDPKKMLVGGASAIDHARRMQGKGVASMPQIDWPELIAFKRSFTEKARGQLRGEGHCRLSRAGQVYRAEQRSSRGRGARRRAHSDRHGRKAGDARHSRRRTFNRQ